MVLLFTNKLIMTHLNYFTIHKNKKPKKAKYSDITASQKIGIEKCLAFFKEQTELLKKQKDEQNN